MSIIAVFIFGSVFHFPKIQLNRTREGCGNIKRGMLYFSILTDLDFYFDQIISILLNMHDFLEKMMSEYKYK